MSVFVSEPSRVRTKQVHCREEIYFRALEIILPTISADGKELEFKEIVTLMEQFMAGMQSVASSSQNREKNYFTLEISLENNSDQMALFVSVPESKSDLFEKQILGLFDNVQVTEIFDDYNIFHYSGTTAASVATSSVNDMLEMKTYEEFDHDPVRVIVNTPTLNVDGEIFISATVIGYLEGGSSTITVDGKWRQEHASAFTPGASAVIFNDAADTIIGAQRRSCIPDFFHSLCKHGIMY